MRKIILTILVILAGVCPVQAGVWWEDGHLEINDGNVYDGELFIIDQGSVDMFGGIVGKLETWDYSTGNIYGGHIDWLFTKDSSIVRIHGGTLDWLGAFHDSSAYLYAYDVTYHLTGGLENRPWLEGTYYRNDTPFSFSFYNDTSYSHLIIVPEPVDAEIDIDPDTLNLASKGKWISCKIWLPQEYDVAEIDPETILLEQRVKADWAWFNEQQQLAMAKFSRSEVQGILEVGELELTITGQLIDGMTFEGTDTVKVIDKGSKKK